MLCLRRSRLHIRFYGFISFACICVVILYSQRKIRIKKETIWHFIPRDTLSSVSSTSQNSQCDEKHIVLLCLGSDGTRETTFLLKTILHFRQAPLHLHILADPIGNATISLLLDTWRLPAVKFTVYVLPELQRDLDFATIIFFSLKKLLPRDTQKVIILHPQMRVLSYINRLYDSFDAFTENQFIGITRGPKAIKEGNSNLIHQFFVDVILMDLEKAKNYTKSKAVKFGDWTGVHAYLERLSSHLYILPCTWNVRLDSNFDYQACLGNETPKALFYGKDQNTFTNLQIIESAKETVYNILNSNGEIWRTMSTLCFTAKPANVAYSKSACEQYLYITKLKRRTHINYYTGGQAFSSADDNEITLVTQFTMDRFQIFVRFALQWRGPIAAVLYATDEEAARCFAALQSTKLKTKKNLAVHVVYKREKFYPINYLRNVGLSHVATPYTVFIDVDLVLNPDANAYLKKLLASKKATARRRDLLVIPAFETTDGSDYVPQNRSQLLTAIKSGKMIGYRMNKGWKLGHQPVNYPQWIKATAPYKIAYKNAFEPYVVGLTSMLPLYEESLLERMADKISYTRHLYMAGFTFEVVDQAFVVHVPHPRSEGTLYWASHGNYFKCGSILSDGFAKRINFTKPGKIKTMKTQ